ncbi:MAG: S9 family peptidase [Ignavibacteriae bacterium]|nr:S9 family peptidase [Ignavibacteria bacterium]MBI3364958.1 S9 family peptidase [Ignavibacteriota bacterium]
MRRLYIFTLYVFILCIVSMRCVVSAQERNKEFTLEDIFTSSKFNGKEINGFQWYDGGKSFTYIEMDTATKQTDIWIYDVVSGKRSKFVNAGDLVLQKGETPFSIGNYTWSPDKEKILFTGTLAARRLKSGGNFFLYDLKKKHFIQLTRSELEQMNTKFSPDGKLIGFVRENNLFTLNVEDGTETQLTFDGAQHILNGHFDWVYEEEFSIIDGWQWSPDGKYIAYWQIDENREPSFPVINFLPLYQDITYQRYPKAGERNAIIRIGILSLETKKTAWADIGAPLDSTQDTYIPRIRWTNKPGLLAVERLNRHQNKLDLTFVDATSGIARIILTETSDTWLDLRDDLTFLKKSDEFIWSSDRDGFLHLYRYKTDGTLINQVTQGRWDIDHLIGVDERSGTVYFQAGITSPINREVYSVGLDGKHFRRITKEEGTNDASFSPDYSVFLHTFSDVNTPSRMSLRKNDGSLLHVAETGTIVALDDYTIRPKIFFTFKTSDGVELNGWMIKPANLDPAKKYPVLMHVYGGPGSQEVRNSWGGTRFLWHQLLVQKGYIIACVDNRGTGARGKEFLTVTYKHLGKWETHDQIEGAKYLASLPYVDPLRIGITGGSYGGYMTLLCLLQGNDVFKAGIASSSVTHWKFYDTIYTERYMLTPKENPEGYEESAPLSYAKQLKGKLLIVHGTDDDNVHMQNSITMINELVKEKKLFQTSLYPGSKHGIRQRLQYYMTMTDFLLYNL